MAFTGQLGSSDAILGKSLALGFAGSGGNPLNQFVSNVLGLTAGESAVYDPVVNVLAANRLFFIGDDTSGTQTVTSNYITEVVSNTLTSTQQLGFSPTLDVTNFLGFTVYFDPEGIPVGNWLGMTVGQHAGVLTTIAAANFFFTAPDQNNLVTQLFLANNTLGFVAVVAAFSDQLVENSLGFVDVVTSSGTTNDRLINQGFIRQTLGYTITDSARCRDQEYSPLVGEGDDGFAELQVSPPVLGTGTFTLTFPRISPTTTLVLENPDFGNADTLTFTRIDRKTRGGDRLIFGDPKWSAFEVLELSAFGVCGATADDIIDFLNVSVGKEIGLQDWEGRDWAGFIREPGTDVIESEEGFRVTIVFEGKLRVSDVQHLSQNVIHNGQEVIHTQP